MRIVYYKIRRFSAIRSCEYLEYNEEVKGAGLLTVRELKALKERIIKRSSIAIDEGNIIFCNTIQISDD